MLILRAKENATSDPLCCEIVGIFMIILQEETILYVLKYYKRKEGWENHTFLIYFSKWEFNKFS